MTYKVPGLPVYRKTLHNRYHVIKIRNREDVYDAFRALQLAWGKGTRLTETRDMLTISHRDHEELSFPLERVASVGIEGHETPPGIDRVIVINLESGEVGTGYMYPHLDFSEVSGDA